MVRRICSVGWKRLLKVLFSLHCLFTIFLLVRYSFKYDITKQQVTAVEFVDQEISAVVHTSMKSETLSFVHHSFAHPIKLGISTLDGAITEMCGGSFIAFSQRFAELHNVLVQPKLSKGKPGGEEIKTVLNQSEYEEIFEPLPGYFSLNCKQLPKYSFHKSTNMNDWLKTIKFSKDCKECSVTDRWTLLVERYEYAHFLFQMADVYNAFLLLLKFQLQPSEVDIVLMDGHPKGAFDSVWSTLFGNMVRAGNVSEPIVYHKMLWNILGYNSPLLDMKSNTPFLEDFRSFFLNGFQVPTARELNCSSLSVLFIWRRDYLAHPRNPHGSVQRKIMNEGELLQTAVDLLPGHSVQGLQIDTLSFEDQLRLISETDILIGMHGAGLTHALFLPNHGGLLEFAPKYYGKGPSRFSAIANWRKMHYMKWENKDNINEHANYYTTIPSDIVKKYLKEMVEKMCH